jgi:hypothetical protein
MYDQRKVNEQSTRNDLLSLKIIFEDLIKENN